MKNNIFKPLAAFAAAIIFTGCTLPGEQVQDDEILPGSYDTEPAQQQEEIINYEWALEPSIDAENIIVFDGSQVDPDRSDHSNMYEYYAVISRSGVYGLIDYAGNVVVAPDYKYYFIAPNGQIVLYNTLDEKGEQREYCTLNADGEVVDYFDGSESARVKYYYDEENKTIYYAKESEDWLVHRYEDKKTVVALQADVLDNGMSIEVVEPEVGAERYGMVNLDGVVLDFEYESFYAPAFKGVGITGAAFKKDGKWGYVDSKGKQLIDFNCDEVFSSYNGELCDDPDIGHPYLYSEDLLPVSINYTFGYYNMDGECIVKSNEFSQARPVHHGKAWVSDGTAWGVIRFGEEEEEEETLTTTTTTTGSTYNWNTTTSETTAETTKKNKKTSPANTTTDDEVVAPDPQQTEPTEPVYTDPTDTDPGYVDPSVTDPAYTDPGYVDPTVTEPEYTDPGYVDPPVTDPVYTDPGYVDPGAENGGY